MKVKNRKFKLNYKINKVTLNMDEAEIREAL